MSDDGSDAGEVSVPEPVVVEYCPVTGIPAEYNDYLPKDCLEFKKWKALKEGGEEKLAELNLKDKDADEEVELPGGKKKKKPGKEIILDSKTVRGKKKVCIIVGLDTFGIKLNEAAKLLGKKFACGASVGKTNDGTRKTIDVQGDFATKIAQFLLEKYGDEAGLKKKYFYSIVAKKKSPTFDE